MGYCILLCCVVLHCIVLYIFFRYWCFTQWYYFIILLYFIILFFAYTNAQTSTTYAPRPHLKVKHFLKVHKVFLTLQGLYWMTDWYSCEEVPKLGPVNSSHAPAQQWEDWDHQRRSRMLGRFGHKFFYPAITECFFVLQSPWLGMLKIVPRPSKRMTFKDLNCFYEVRSDIPNEDTHQLVQVRKQFTLSWKGNWWKRWSSRSF